MFQTWTAILCYMSFPPFQPVIFLTVCDQRRRNWWIQIVQPHKKYNIYICPCRGVAVAVAAWPRPIHNIVALNYKSALASWSWCHVHQPIGSFGRRVGYKPEKVEATREQLSDQAPLLPCKSLSTAALPSSVFVPKKNLDKLYIMKGETPLIQTVPTTLTWPEAHFNTLANAGCSSPANTTQTFEPIAGKRCPDWSEMRQQQSIRNRYYHRGRHFSLLIRNVMWLINHDLQFYIYRLKSSVQFIHLWWNLIPWLLDADDEPILEVWHSV